jgi:hypothetical protein
MGQYPTEKQPRAQLDRTVLQQDQAMSARLTTRYDKLAANYLAFASIRI